MNNLDKAREWAEEYKGFDHLTHRVKAAIDIILSLPDQWVDVEKVQDLIDLYKCARDANGSGTEGWVINDLVIGNLEDLLLPKLPTLADMTTEERAACQWMQARVETDERADIGVISTIWRDRAALIYPSGFTGSVENWRITPLPDLPKLEWPGGVVDAENVDEPETVESDSIHTPMQPSEVPPNEPWLIEANRIKAIGTRYKGDAHAPWTVAALDGAFAGDYLDSEITLIHKLVPEPPALPEGMRLADHVEYGRVVVSPGVDVRGEHSIFYLGNEYLGGATYRYATPDELTFLDGLDK